MAEDNKDVAPGKNHSDPHHADAAKAPSGTVDQKHVALTAHHWAQQIDDGKCIVVTLGQVAVTDPNDLPDLDDLLDNNLIQPGDEVLAFVRRARA